MWVFENLKVPGCEENFGPFRIERPTSCCSVRQSGPLAAHFDAFARSCKLGSKVRVVLSSGQPSPTRPDRE